MEQSEIETQSHQHGALDYNPQAQLKKNKSLYLIQTFQALICFYLFKKDYAITKKSSSKLIHNFHFEFNF